MVRIFSEEHKNKIRQSIKNRWKEGKQRLAEQCNNCGTFISKSKIHNCEEHNKKISETIKKNPNRYWLNKKRERYVIEAMQEGLKKMPIKYGEQNNAWKGGSKLYYHNLARKLISEKIGRKLSSKDIVHHIDGNYKNNNLSNLLLTNRSEHIKIHLRQKDICPGQYRN
jgi:hypothetical protein